MRVISGKLKGRRFEMPNAGWKTRPTTDIAREALFNILQHQIDLEGLEVLDLFAGSGSIGYEFLSRSAAKVTFVEKFGGCIKFIKQQLRIFDVEKNARLCKEDVFRFLQTAVAESYDLVFADPPYAMQQMLQLPDLVFERKLLKKDGILIIEHDERHNFEKHTNFVEMRKYGQSRFSFFE